MAGKSSECQAKVLAFNMWGNREPMKVFDKRNDTVSAMLQGLTDGSQIEEGYNVERTNLF